MTDKKLDLRNGHIGGQKKNWLDEPLSDDGWLGDIKMSASISAPIALLVACVVGFAMMLLK